MFVPVYVTQDERGDFLGRSPSIEHFTFRGLTLGLLIDDVKHMVGVVASSMADAEETIANAEGFEGGQWICVPIGVTATDARERRNVSLSSRLIARIETARKGGGMTFSGWLAQAAADKLSRGG